MTPHLLTNMDFWDATRDAFHTIAIVWLVWRSF